MIFDFCHLPSECFEDFLSHIGSVNQGIGSNYKLVFPLKKYIKDVDFLSKRCLVSHIYRNLPNISRPKANFLFINSFSCLKNIDYIMKKRNLR